MSEYTSIYDTYLDETRTYTKQYEIERNRTGFVYGAKLNCEVSRKISFYVGVDGFTNQTVIIGSSDYETNRIKFSLGMNFF